MDGGLCGGCNGGVCDGRLVICWVVVVTVGGWWIGWWVENLNGGMRSDIDGR